MGKKENHKNDFNLLFKDFFNNKDQNPISEYIIKNSDLPGRRGNLEMAEAFGDSILEINSDHHDLVRSYLINLINISHIEAPVNNPREMLPFCGIVGLTSLTILDKNRLTEFLIILKKLSNDPRWRMREAVGMALSKLIDSYSDITLSALESWINKNNWLEMRAIAAGLAEPIILKNKVISEKALDILKIIFNSIITQNKNQKNSETFKVLRKGLGYCLSVIVQTNPINGFKFMEYLTTINDNDIKWILKENLKKTRLTKNFPKEVAAINRILN